MVKKKPERSCIGCGKKGPKSEFIRIARSPEGVFSLDQTGRQNGRGAYLCKSESCFREAIRHRALHRAFREPVPQEAYAGIAAQWEELFGSAPA